MTLSTYERAGISGDEDLEVLSPRQLASVIKEGWRAGGDPDAARAVAEHVSLRHAKSLQLDLAYEEYCLRREAGEAPDLGEFCARFPSMQASLRRLLAAHQLLEENPELIDQSGPVWPEPGRTFLGFRLLEELGRGAFARVYLAEEPALGNRLVAVKVALRGGAEAETLGRLRHRNIVPVHSVREDSVTGLTAVCMPYLGRATLCDLLDRTTADGRVPRQARVILEAINATAEAAADAASMPIPDGILRRGAYTDGITLFGAQLAEALAYAHHLGVIHRDLKPSNVLLSPDGVPLLLDFNLSHDERLTDRRLGGTLPYMPPEQLRATDPTVEADGGQMDARSDLFGLGVILYELLAGVHPFGPLPAACTHAELRTLLLERQERGPRPLRQLCPALEGAVAKLIESCLAFKPEDRPPTAAEVAATLRRAIVPAQRAKRWLKRRPLVVAAASVLLVAGMLGAVAAAGTPDRAPVENRGLPLDLGIEASRTGDYALAVKHLKAAVELEPESFAAAFTCARARQLLGEHDDKSYSFALDDYKAARNLAPTSEAAARINACMGYCLVQRKQPKDGMQYFEQALDAGFKTAEVYNNLGFCYAKLMRPEEAYHMFDKAIELNDKLQAPRYNRAVTGLQLALRPPGDLAKHRPEGAPPVVAIDPRQALRQAIADIAEVIRSKPLAGEVYLNAARLYAVSAREEATHTETALAYLQEAVQKGVGDSRFWKGDHTFAGLASDPRFIELTKQKPNTQPIKAAPLIDPLKGAIDLSPGQ